MKSTKIHGIFAQFYSGQVDRSSEAPKGKILKIRRYYRNDLTSGLNDPTIYNKKDSVEKKYHILDTKDRCYRTS